MRTGNLVYLIRSAALSVNYMNDVQIQTEFKRVARKVEDIWVDFFNLYNQVHGQQYDVRTAYQEWLQASGARLLYSTNVENFYNAALSALAVKLQSGTVKVGVPIDCSSRKEDFGLNELAQLRNSLPSRITWTYP
ncbi:hypothetical protein C8T65DRAFT_771686 [Cerioporus squamosus]|nr:hypothetical protein C8T65DRAFT_771686 [Cerioporus squamosus]